MKRQQWGCFDLQLAWIKKSCNSLTLRPTRSKVLKFHHPLSVVTPSNQLQQIEPGDTVYARFFGEETLVVKGVAKTSLLFPHYLCQLEDAVHLIPKIHLSTKNLLPLTGDGNRLQTELPLTA